jgi:hypothetical protein
VKGLSQIAAPITSLHKKGKIIEWIEKYEKSFQILKKNIKTSLVLTIPNPNGKFMVITYTLGEVV